MSESNDAPNKLKEPATSYTHKKRSCGKEAVIDDELKKYGDVLSKQKKS